MAIEVFDRYIGEINEVYLPDLKTKGAFRTG